MKLLIINLVLASLAAYSNASVGSLSVKDNQVLINGEVGMLRGLSLYWSNDGWGGEKFYTADVVSSLKNDWNANIVRAAMGVNENGGYLSNPTGNKNRVKTVVNAAIANDMHVIIDWHSHYAHRYESQAIAFFKEMAKEYGTMNNIIYEIFNEPKTGLTWSEHVKPYAIAVIQAIRAIDPDNLIVVGTPNYSQDVNVAANDPIVGFKNVAYSLHFYAGSHKEELREKAITALEKNAALFVTEWGTVNADGDGPVDSDEANNWIDFLEGTSISHCNWCYNDAPEGTSALKPDSGALTGGRFSTSALTDSGKYVYNLLQLDDL